MSRRASRPSGGRENDGPGSVLVFFCHSRSGPARRMESLLAHLERIERDHLRVMRVDIEEEPELAERFKVTRVPTLVLVRGKRTVARLEGRASTPEIEELLAVAGARPSE